MQRRTFCLGLASVSATFPLAGCSAPNETEIDVDPEGISSGSRGDQSEDGVITEDNTTDDSDDAVEKADTETVEPDPITFRGEGSLLTDTFDLAGGFVAADIEHAGDEGPFQVRLIDSESGHLVRRLASESGEWSGEIGRAFDAGRYRLDIDAHCEWSVELRQPRPTDGGKPPLEEQCKIPTVLGPYELDGRLQVAARHWGSQRFIVRAHDANADGNALGTSIINESGEFDGSARFSKQGLTWITVEGDGDWEIEIE